MKIFFRPVNLLKNRLIVLVFLLISIYGCAQKSRYQRPSHSYQPSSYDSTHLIVWVKPGQTGSDFSKWLDGFQKLYGPTDVTDNCASCTDKSLMLLGGIGAENFVSGQTASGGSGGRKNASTGGDGPVYWSLDFYVEFTDTVNIYQEEHYPPRPTKKMRPGGATVAVFDTGVDTAANLPLTSYLYQSDDPSCFGKNANSGWNLTATPFDVNWKDDNIGPMLHGEPLLHGTAVSSLIVNQGIQYNRTLHLLPVKTHDANGKSDLFKVLCGIAYAADRGADIINASFGYYASKTVDSAAVLFKEFIRFYLDSKKHILLIAAAGNRDDKNEFKVLPFSSALPASHYRNLDNVAFYPASLAADLRNVIAVTTVNEGFNKVSPAQNFSNRVVDIGVNADMNYSFMHPFLIPHSTLEGSSFATPVVTGKIAANYNLIAAALSLGVYKKIQLINILLSQKLAHHNMAFDGLIRKGILMKK